MRIRTSNLSEVAHLLGKNYRIVDVNLRPGTYGVQELFVTFEGKLIGLDHKDFIFRGCTSMDKIPEALEAVRDEIRNVQGVRV